MKKITILFHAGITLHISTCKKRFAWDQGIIYLAVQSQNNKIKKNSRRRLGGAAIAWYQRIHFFFKEGILP